jgi:hypothetical protein
METFKHLLKIMSTPFRSRETFIVTIKSSLPHIAADQHIMLRNLVLVWGMRKVGENNGAGGQD